MTHKLPLKMWFPYDYDHNDSQFWLSAGYQLLIGLIYTPVVIIVDMLPVFFICFTIGLIEELFERFERAVDEAKPNKSHQQSENMKKLIKCIKLQQEIKNLVSDITEVFGIVI